MDVVSSCNLQVSTSFPNISEKFGIFLFSLISFAEAMIYGEATFPLPLRVCQVGKVDSSHLFRGKFPLLSFSKSHHITALLSIRSKLTCNSEILVWGLPQISGGPQKPVSSVPQEPSPKALGPVAILSTGVLCRPGLCQQLFCTKGLLSLGPCVAKKACQNTLQSGNNQNTSGLQSSFSSLSPFSIDSFWKPPRSRFSLIVGNSVKKRPF